MRISAQACTDLLKPAHLIHFTGRCRSASGRLKLARAVRRKNPRNVMIDDDLWIRLTAFIEACGIGRPSASSVICQAVQEFVEKRLTESPELRAAFEKRLARPRLVPIVGKSRNQ